MLFYDTSDSMHGGFSNEPINWIGFGCTGDSPGLECETPAVIRLTCQPWAWQTLTPNLQEQFGVRLWFKTKCERTLKFRKKDEFWGGRVKSQFCSLPRSEPHQHITHWSNTVVSHHNSLYNFSLHYHVFFFFLIQANLKGCSPFVFEQKLHWHLLHGVHLCNAHLSSCSKYAPKLTVQ